MAVPFTYTWRSLWARQLTTVLTLGGIALVVFVFASVLMLAEGLEQTMADTGSDMNAIAVRKSANSELVSQIGRDATNIIKAHPEVAHSSDGRPLASTEVYVIINLSKKETNDMGNVTVRGVSPEALELRPQVKLVAGRMLTFGTNEIVVGANIANRFQGCELNDRIRFGEAEWLIVGIFEAAGSAFESEIWGDVEQLMPAFGRPVFSSMTFRLTSYDAFDALKTRIEQDPRTQYLDVKRELQYYREQSEMMSTFIKALGLVVTVIFSIGAVFGAAITMYAAVANRTVEIGTMRALGFKRRSILFAFLIESILLAIVGGGAGIGLASFMSFIRISTTNFGTFSELGFGFAMSPGIILGSLLFALMMGLVGGFLPSVRAARLNILAALREA